MNVKKGGCMEKPFGPEQGGTSLSACWTELNFKNFGVSAWNVQRQLGPGKYKFENLRKVIRRARTSEQLKIPKPNYLI